MSHFDSPAAPPIPVMIGGREYLFTPLRFRDHAEAARRLRQDWPSPHEVLQRMGPGLPPDVQRQLLEVVYREQRRGETVELSDVLRWYRTPEGSLFHKWLLLRTAHPELTLEDVDELLTQAALETDPPALQQTAETDGLPEGWLQSDPCLLEKIPWTQLFARLARQYGWTPAEMQQMTIGQLIQFLPENENLPQAGQSLTKEEAIARARRRARERESFIAEHQELLPYEP